MVVSSANLPPGTFIPEAAGRCGAEQNLSKSPRATTLSSTPADDLDVT
jgi:hypothetical protein